MSLDTLIENHGYWLLALGCLLEGETLLLIAGWAAHRGLLDPAAVLVVAGTAGFAGDEMFFWIGRRHGAAVFLRWPAVARNTERVREMLLRHHEAVIVMVRFAYGLRAVGPVIIGMTPVPAWRFALFNAIGAVIWACLVTAVGWWLGRLAEQLVHVVHAAEGWILVVLSLLGLAVWLWRERRRP